MLLLSVALDGGRTGGGWAERRKYREQQQSDEGELFGDIKRFCESSRLQIIFDRLMKIGSVENFGVDNNLIYSNSSEKLIIT